MSDKPKRKYVNLTDFLMAHDASDSLQEVADRLDMKIESVRSRASKCRKDGINLKKFKSGGGGRKTDVAAANQFLEELRANLADCENRVAQGATAE